MERYKLVERACQLMAHPEAGVTCEPVMAGPDGLTVTFNGTVQAVIEYPAAPVVLGGRRAPCPDYTTAGLARLVACLEAAQRVRFGLRADAPQLSPNWCCCDEETFGSYPEDGECTCGTYKHHVHCGTCGRITQIG